MINFDEKHKKVSSETFKDLELQQLFRFVGDFDVLLFKKVSNNYVEIVPSNNKQYQVSNLDMKVLICNF